MAITSKKLATAAFAGLISASVITAGISSAKAEDSTDHKAGEKANAVDKTTKAEKEKHACKGLNSCKGNGGDGKNECKGKGSCRTDDKKAGE